MVSARIRQKQAPWILLQVVGMNRLKIQLGRGINQEELWMVLQQPLQRRWQQQCLLRVPGAGSMPSVERVVVGGMRDWLLSLAYCPSPFENPGG